MSSIQRYFSYLIQMVYPNNCLLCEANLLKNENCICTICEVKLPYTNYHLLKDNPIEKKLWGRVKIEDAASLLFFEKGLSVQQLISNLKYKNRQDIGEKLGEIYAHTILNASSEFLKVDAIIPVPLHEKKLRKRSYNQCTTFALQLGKIWNKPVFSKAVKRNTNTISQTGKNRISRWENVSNIFEVVQSKKIENKHILLVDDVMTTGATLEALAYKILEVPNTKVSILVMASAI